MNSEDIIRNLLNLAAPDLQDEEARKGRVAARAAWGLATVRAMFAMQDRVTKHRDRIFGELPDDLTDEEIEDLNLPDPPEEAELAALHALIEDMRDRDRWPKELYWGGI